MNTWKLFTCFICAAMAFGINCAAGRQAVQTKTNVELKRLEGDWTVIKLQQGREKLDQDEVRKNTKVTVRQGLLVIRNKFGKMAGTITLDVTKMPRWIDVEDKKTGQKAHGIYELKGNILKLCLGRPGARPSKFEVPEKGLLAFLKRKK